MSHEGLDQPASLLRGTWRCRGAGIKNPCCSGRMKAQRQELGTARLPVGGGVAYAATGSGPYLLVVAGWLSHLELGWAIPA